MKLKKNTVIINDRKFFYWEKNEKSEEALVLLHGFPGNHEGLVDLAGGLGDDYRIIIPIFRRAENQSLCRETAV